MSGSTIGGVVGGVIGFVVSGFNPVGFQVGFMVGSAVGGYLDPTEIKGPRLNDAQTQTSMEGAPRPIVFGTAALSGNIIQCGPLVEHEDTERVGKGGSTEQTTYTYTRTVAVRVCEGPVSGISRIWADDKLIYDTRNPADWPDADIAGMAADTARTASQIAIYLGGETQLPDATLEALPAENGGGSGNVPAYRGTCYVVFRNWDVTRREASFPQMRFEVVSDGTIDDGTGSYDALGYGDMPWRSNAPSSNDPRKPDLAYEYKFVEDGASYNPGDGGWRATVAEAIDDAETATGYAAIGSPQLVGWSTRFYDLGAGDGVNIAPWEDVDAVGQTEWRDRYVLGLHYTRYDADIVYQTEVFGAGGDETGTGACSYYADPIFAIRVITNSVGSTLFSSATIRSAGIAGYDNTWGCYTDSYQVGGLRVYSGYTIACRPKLSCGVDAYPATAIRSPDSSHVYVDTDGTVYTTDNCAEVTGTFKQLQTLAHGLDGGTLGTDVIEKKPIGPVLATGDANDTQAYWEAAYAVAVAAGDMAAGLTYPGNYPVSVTSACQCTYAVGVVSANSVVLSDIVTALCSRVGVASSQLDVSQLTDTVRGFVVGQPMAASDAIRSLQQGYFFDFPEWGDYTDTTTKLRGIKRGGSYNFTITDDDLVDSDEDQDTRPQAVEFPRKLNLITSDVDADYNPTKQTAERRTENVKAVGEANVQLPLSLTRAEAAPKADIMLKVAWMEAEGRTQFTLPEEFSAMVPSDPFMKDSKRWRAEEIEYGDGTVAVKAVRDRTSAYSSDATSGDAIAPSSPTSGIRGPTVLVAMNLPSLRSADNVPGVYVAVQGLAAGWPGCSVMLSVDGGVSEQKVATITQAAVIGELTADCTSSGEPISVKAYYGGVIDSVTADQIAARQNAFAIISSNTAEIGQVQTATEGAAREYDWTDVTRGELGTTAAAHSTGDRFVMLDRAVFIPIDADHAGKTLIFRAVTNGTASANNDTVSLVFDPPTIVYTGGDSTT